MLTEFETCYYFMRQKISLFNDFTVNYAYGLLRWGSTIVKQRLSVVLRMFALYSIGYKTACLALIGLRIKFSLSHKGTNINLSFGAFMIREKTR